MSGQQWLHSDCCLAHSVCETPLLIRHFLISQRLRWAKKKCSSELLWYEQYISLLIISTHHSSSVFCIFPNVLHSYEKDPTFALPSIPIHSSLLHWWHSFCLFKNWLNNGDVLKQGVKCVKKTGGISPQISVVICGWLSMNGMFMDDYYLLFSLNYV